MRQFFELASITIVVGATIPYMIDIVAGRARPARSARIMLLLLVSITLFQQRGLGVGGALSLTIGETILSVMLLGLALKYGVGGLSKSDKICYGLLGVDLALWLITKNNLLALHLTILADTVAFWPTLSKTWRDPKSETALFFWSGVISPLFAIAAEENLSYQALIFPVYICVVNLLEVALIYRVHERVKSARG